MSNSNGNTATLGNQKKMNNFDRLPDEMLCKICSYLNIAQLIKVGKVCGRFRHVAQSRCFWRKVVPTPNRNLNFITGSIDDIITAAGHCIGELDLTGCQITLPLFLPGSEVADKNFRINLEKLNLSNTFFYEKSEGKSFELAAKGEGIAAIMEKCKAKEVVLDGDIMSIMTLFDAFRKNEQIEGVSMEYFQIIDELPNINFGDFFANFNNLKVFNLSSNYLYVKQLRKVCRHLPKTLEKFMLNNVDLEGHYPEIFENIVRRAPNLQVLGVLPRYLKKPNVLDKLNKLKQLHSIHLHHADWNKAKYEIENVLRTLTNLKHVDFVKQKSVGRMRKINIVVSTQDFGKRLEWFQVWIDTKPDIYNFIWSFHFHRPQ